MRYAVFALSLLIFVCSSMTSGSEEYYAPDAAKSPPPMDLNKSTPPIDGSYSHGSDADIYRGFMSWRSISNLYSSTITEDLEHHGYAGILIDSAVYIDVQAKHIVYKPSEIRLEPPAKATGREDWQTLYAPTMRPPGGSCLEIGSRYATPPNSLRGASQIAEVFVWDFCNGKTVGYVRGDSLIPNVKLPIAIDQGFINSWTLTLSSGRRAYGARITRGPVLGDGDAVWTAWLYNVHDKGWSRLYERKGIWSKNMWGWNIFETYFQRGQCPKNVPNFTAWDILFRNKINGKLYKALPLSASMNTRISNGTMTANNRCFVPDTDPESFRFRNLPNNSGWVVESTGH